MLRSLNSLVFFVFTVAALLFLMFVLDNGENRLRPCVMAAADFGVFTCMLARKRWPRTFTSEGNNAARLNGTDHDTELGVNIVQRG